LSSAAVAIRYPWLAPFLPSHGIGQLIDHTLLRPEAVESDLRRLAAEAVRSDFAAVCVNGQWTATMARQLRGTSVRVASVVGFPLGAAGRTAKVAEARVAIENGADEIDMVIALGLAKSGRWAEVGDEVAAVVDVVDGRLVKVILETAILTAEEIALGAETAVAAGAGMVKTSTGFHLAGGATMEAVALLRRAVGDRAGVKAAGGIRTPEQALVMLAAGASRLGTSRAALWADCLGPAAPPLASLLLRASGERS
jgi:deoxyribose-phosphate aldolase